MKASVKLNSIYTAQPSQPCRTTSVLQSTCAGKADGAAAAVFAAAGAFSSCCAVEARAVAALAASPPVAFDAAAAAAGTGAVSFTGLGVFSLAAAGATAALAAEAGSAAAPAPVRKNIILFQLYRNQLHVRKMSSSSRWVLRLLCGGASLWCFGDHSKLQPSRFTGNSFSQGQLGFEGPQLSKWGRSKQTNTWYSSRTYQT